MSVITTHTIVVVQQSKSRSPGICVSSIDIGICFVSLWTILRHDIKLNGDTLHIHFHYIRRSLTAPL